MNLGSRLGTSRAVIAATVLAAVLAAATPGVAQGAPQGTAAAETRGTLIDSVDQLRAAVTAGGVYTLSADNFLLDEPLEVTRDLTLWGQGHEFSVLRVRGAAAALIIRGGAGVRVHGVHFDGVVNGTVRADGTRDSGAGLDLIRVHDGTLELVASRLSRARYGADPAREYGRGCGLVIYGTAVTQVSDSRFENNQLCAVEVRDSASFELSGSTVRANLNGVFAEADSHVVLRDNTFEANQAQAIIIRGSADATIENNVIVNNGTVLDTAAEENDAVRLGGTATITLSGNRFLGNPRFSLSVHGEAVVTSIGNHFEGNGGLSAATKMYYSAIILEERSLVISSADVFIANPAGAIELIGQARLEMRDAEVRRTGSFASLYLGMSTSAALIDASFTDNEGSVFVSDTAAVTITGGEFLDGGAAAVYVDKFGSLSIEGALVTGNSGAAIGVADDATASITRTVIERNGAGVVFMDRAHGTVTGSSFAGNARNAIAYQGRATGTATDNDVQHAQGEAIHVAAGAGAEVDGNRMVEAGR